VRDTRTIPLREKDEMLISRRAIRGMIKEHGINTASRKPVRGTTTVKKRQ
jgi:hypothetical protein